MSDDSKIKVRALLDRLMVSGDLIGGTLSGLKKGVSKEVRKVGFRPLLIKGKLALQLEHHEAKKVIHENISTEEGAQKLQELLETFYSQMVIFTNEADYQILTNKKGYAILKKPATKKVDPSRLQHNKAKQYILSEGTPYPFLIELGIMDAQGKVFKAKYDKFRQLNRYLEFIRDCVNVERMPKDRPIRIIDFGCGKAYLTFALYHYLVKELGYMVSITGLDLKVEVMQFCSETAVRLGFEGLRFEIGDIAEYEGTDAVDMVVSLHACDTATDAALAKAVGWGAKVILAVPCCQHEFYPLVQQETLTPLLKHGLLKERFASLATDAVRGMMLEAYGYDVQMVEFIDMEHTPKNILIRAIQKSDQIGGLSSREFAAYKAFKSSLGLEKTYIDKVFENIIK